MQFLYRDTGDSGLRTYRSGYQPKVFVSISRHADLMLVLPLFILKWSTQFTAMNTITLADLTDYVPAVQQRSGVAAAIASSV